MISERSGMVGDQGLLGCGEDRMLDAGEMGSRVLVGEDMAGGRARRNSEL